ncbi:hypothetical protein [Methylomonas sp. MgM2]
MKKKPRPYLFRSFAVGLAMLMVFFVPPVWAGQTADDLSCPSFVEIQDELAQRKNKLEKMQWGLRQLIDGKVVTDIALNALFMIDISDNEAVAKRIIDLQREIDATQPQDPFLICGSSLDNLRSVTDEVWNLQRTVAELRLQILSLPQDKRSSILRPQIEASVQADTVKQLRQEHQSALQEQKEAAKSLARVEQAVLQQAAGASGDLATERAELERIRSELTILQVKWVSDLEQQATFYKDISQKLAQFARSILQPESLPEIKEEYENAVRIWRTLVDKTGKVVSGRYALALPKLPDYPQKLLEQMGDTAEARTYANAYAEAKEFRDGLQQKIESRLQDSVDLHYRLLLQSGEIRSQLLNQLLDRGDLSPLQLSKDCLLDIRREFTIVPYRWSATFYLRSLEIRRQLHQGWEGLMQIASSLLALLVFLLIPWGIWIATQQLKQRLDQWRLVLVTQSRKFHSARYLALTIQKLLPYVQWLVMLLALQLVQQLLAVTVFSELAMLLPYLRYYIYYRLLRQLFQCDFIWINRQIRIAKLWDLRRKADRAVKSFGLTVFFIFCVLASIEGLIRRGLIYHFATRTLFVLTVAIAMVFAYQWRGIIGAGLIKLIPGAVGQKIAQVCSGRWGILFAIPAFCLIVLLMLLRQATIWIGRFELPKRIAAEIFRYQLESALDRGRFIASSPPPADYKSAFSLIGAFTPEQLLSPAELGLNEIHTQLKSWGSETDTVRSVAIVGHKGGGKTCLLQYLEKAFAAEHIIRIAVPPKLTSREQVLHLFAGIPTLPCDSESNSNHPKAPIEAKTLLLVDDAHNLFLAKQDGFVGFDTFLEIINQANPKLYWAVAFNVYAWAYLNSVYGNHQYFDAVIRLKPWSERAIQALIMTAHTRTGYRIFYDDIIEAAGIQGDSEHAAYIENRFFSLLRQQSRGNPRLAVHLWLSALHQIGDNSLRVGLPDEPEIAKLSEIPQDVLFVFASIARHENLTPHQAVLTTRLPEGVVKRAMEFGLRINLLDCGQGQVYRLAALYQYPLLNYLQAKHCLYE